jgi:hypothetical protein
MYVNPYLIQELKLKNPSVLKEVLPLYPTVRKTEGEVKVCFSTLVRKKYEGVYYLIPMEFEDKVESRAIHGIHSAVHKYLMLGELTFLDVKDDNQSNEVERLKNL